MSPCRGHEQVDSVDDKKRLYTDDPCFKSVQYRTVQWNLNPDNVTVHR